MCRSFYGVVLLLGSLFFVTAGHSQVTLTEPLPVAAGLASGSIQGEVIPAFTNDSLTEVFDGNPFTEAAVGDSDFLQITLHFNEPAPFSASKVFFWNNGQWKLEIADTEADLESGQGSYQLLVDNRTFVAFAWDSLTFPSVSPVYVRLTAQNLQGNGVYLGEWVLQSSLTITSLYIYPHPPKVIPGTSLQLKVKAVDEYGRFCPYPLDEPVVWSVENTAVARVGEFGKLEGVSLGTTTVTARSASGRLQGTAPVSVLSDFQSRNAPTKVVNVALVIQNPVINTATGQRINQVWGWMDPMKLVNQILEEFHQMSDGVIDYQIVETHNDTHIFTELDGKTLSLDTLAYFFNPANHKLYGRTVEGTLQNLAEVQSRIRYNYKAMCDQYDFGPKRNDGVIDEIWVYSFPFSGLYESQLIGPNAFWYNSPPIRDYAPLHKLLPVMGWNYERGVAEAIHSYGHRMESAMRKAYGRWDVTNPDPNNWELFTRYDQVVPGGAHIGNIHFPPNGQFDYDYGNTRFVPSYADNWKRYPYLLDQTRTFNCGEWGCDQLGYMRWWFNHLPRYTGTYEGILNNWWHYAVDFEEAVELARQESITAVENFEWKRPVSGYYLAQNWPNPFNSSTVIRFRLARAGTVELKIYDTLGRQVETLVNKWMPAGEHSVIFEGGRRPSGVYFCRLRAGAYVKTEKLLFIR